MLGRCSACFGATSRVFLATALVSSGVWSGSIVSCSPSVRSLLLLQFVHVNRGEELITKLHENAGCQCFGEDVSDLIMGRNPLQRDEFRKNLITNEVMLDSNVLAESMRSVIVRQCDGGFVVAENERYRWRPCVGTHPCEESNLEQQLIQPHGALRGIAYGHVFRLAGGQCDGSLLLGSEIDGTTAQTNDPASCRSASILATAPIGISEYDHGRSRACGSWVWRCGGIHATIE